MILTATGTVLGVRAMPANRKTGELSRWKSLDLYTADGPAELRIDVDADVPDPGSHVLVKVGVSAYSGWVRDGAAGDAKLIFTALSLEVDQGVAPVRGPRSVKAAG